MSPSQKLENFRQKKYFIFIRAKKTREFYLEKYFAE